MYAQHLVDDVCARNVSTFTYVSVRTPHSGRRVPLALADFVQQTTLSKNFQLPSG